MHSLPTSQRCAVVDCVAVPAGGLRVRVEWFGVFGFFMERFGRRGGRGTFPHLLRAKHLEPFRRRLGLARS